MIRRASFGAPVCSLEAACGLSVHAAYFSLYIYLQGSKLTIEIKQGAASMRLMGRYKNILTIFPFPTTFGVLLSQAYPCELLFLLSCTSLLWERQYAHECIGTEISKWQNLIIHLSKLSRVDPQPQTSPTWLIYWDLYKKWLLGRHAMVLPFIASLTLQAVTKWRRMYRVRLQSPFITQDCDTTGQDCVE